MEDIDLICVKCLSCGEVQYIKRTEIREDENGTFVECAKCGATFDVCEGEV